MNSYALRVIAIAALASGPILAGYRPALAPVRASALAGAALPRPPFVLAQATGAGRSRSLQSSPSACRG